MQTFKQFLLEKLKISQARKYMKISGGRHKELLDNVFKGENRIYFPINITFEDIKTTPLIRKIRAHIEKKGYPIEKFSYLGGYIESKKNRLKISKLIRDNEDLANAYFEDPIRDEDKVALFEKELLVVISRHPYDIAGMSTDRHWTSCMNLNPNREGEKGAMRHHIKDDIEQGTIVSYLIKANDKNIKNPYSRILIKPFIQGSGEEISDKVYAAENAYGVQNETFQEFIDDWVEKNLNTGKQGLYRIHPALYQDTTPAYKMLGEFNVDEFLSKYQQDETGTVIIPHSINWENNPLDLAELPFKGRQVIIKGDFIIIGCNIKSLEGSPVAVEGDFLCMENDLRSLKGCPMRIGKSFNCSNNPLYNLIGGPTDVGYMRNIKNDDYICSSCRLTSLNGVPERITGGFYCAQNNLKDFRGGPKWVGGDYRAAKNPIVSLQGLPIHIGGNLDIVVNPGEGHYFTRAEVLRVSNVRGEVWSRPEERKFM